MEFNNDFPQVTETLIRGSSGSEVFDLGKNDQIQSNPPASTDELVSNFQDSVGDSMVRDSTSRLVMSGFSRSCCTDSQLANKHLTAKRDACQHAYAAMIAAREQLGEFGIFLDNKLSQICSLDHPVERQAEEFKIVYNKNEYDKKFWILAISKLEEKVKKLKEEHSQLSRKAHDCAGSISELDRVVSAFQMLGAQCEEFKKKYVEEQNKRRKLFNEVQELKGNIRVFCRCRPLSKEEHSSGCSTVVDFTDAKEGQLGILTSGSNTKLFRFDKVYSPKDDQVAVFVDASPMATSVLDGYNVCIFAYGQTGTGKTFTMEGTEQNRGVNYRILEQLFQIAGQRSATFSYEISVSVLEVYNELIRDLLATSNSPKKLSIKQVSEGSRSVSGIVETKVVDADDAWKMLRIGSNARAVGSNNVNEHSSRSHCMLCVMVKAKNSINGECTKSRLWLVDLAGSERLAKTGVKGDRLKETQNINKSLSALGDVISALANKSSHIPYRNSKLTHLLQDSLGGNSKTLMFVQISPSNNDLGETVSSLNFASRVRGVELAPAKKQIDTTELQETKALVQDLERKLKAQVQESELQSTTLKQQVKKLEEKLKEKEHQLEQSRRTPHLDNAEVAAAIPIVVAKPCVKDETMTEIDPCVLRSSNSSNRMSHGSTILKRGEYTIKTRRQQKFRNGETENQMPSSAPLPDKSIRKSVSAKPLSRVSKTVRPVTTPQRPIAHTRVIRDYGQGTKEKDTKKRKRC